MGSDDDVLPGAKKDPLDGPEMAKRVVILPLMLADAAEGQGDLRRAREIDEATRKLWAKTGKALDSFFVGCDRRKAVELLNAGRPCEAAQILACQPTEYADLLDRSGINLMQLYVLKSRIAALKVLVAALIQTGKAERISEAESI